MPEIKLTEKEKWEITMLALNEAAEIEKARNIAISTLIAIKFGINATRFIVERKS